MKISKYIYTIALAALAVGAPVCSMASEAPQPEAVAQDNPVVKVLHGALSIEIPGDANRQVAIYAITGQVVKQATLTPGANTVELPAGYYIVRIGHFSKTVVVK